MYELEDIKSWDEYLEDAKKCFSERGVLDLLEYRDEGLCLHELCPAVLDGYIDLPRCGARRCGVCKKEVTLSFDRCNDDCEVCIYRK